VAHGDGTKIKNLNIKYSSHLTSPNAVLMKTSQNSTRFGAIFPEPFDCRPEPNLDEPRAIHPVGVDIPLHITVILDL